MGAILWERISWAGLKDPGWVGNLEYMSHMLSVTADSIHSRHRGTGEQLHCMVHVLFSLGLDKSCRLFRLSSWRGDAVSSLWWCACCVLGAFLSFVPWWAAFNLIYWGRPPNSLSQ